MKSSYIQKTVKINNTTTGNIYLLSPLQYETSVQTDLGDDGLKKGKVVNPECQRTSIINAGYTCSYLEKTLYLFFGEEDRAIFFIGFNNFNDEQQLQMALNQISKLMAQKDSVYVYVKDAFSHATWASRARKDPSIVFKRSNGEEIKTYTHYSWFDGASVRGTNYSYDGIDGYQNVQKFINSIVQQPTEEASLVSELRRFSITLPVPNNITTADEEDLNSKDENNYQSTTKIL